MILEELLSKIRKVTDEDRENLISVSYSKLSLKNQCDYRYNERYNKKKYSSKGSIATEIGSILHKGLEMKGRSKIQKKDVDYDEIINAVLQGCEEQTDKGTEHLIGINTIKEKYKKEWETVDISSDMNYDDKMDIYFHDVLTSRMESDEWTTLGTEIKFEFVYDNRCVLYGFIDRVDAKLNEYGEIQELGVIDYKSSKKIFREADIKTPLQMVIYDLACLQIYGILPTYHEYDFILLDQKQTTNTGVCSKGYLNRGLKKIDKTLDSIEECSKLELFEPSPTPLCYWCEYADITHTPNADPKFAGDCPYYSLWTPINKTFQVNKNFIPNEEIIKRKILI